MSGNRSNSAGAFYRFCRDWHGYISALAFLSLIFFSLTGIFLNHPEWFAGARAVQHTQTVRLDAGSLSRARAAPDPARAMALLVSDASQVRGAFKSGEIFDGEAFLRFEGVTGATDATIDLSSGGAEISTTRANAVTILNDLHRGKNAGAVWKAVIDISGGLVIALSLIGFVLFFSMRFRLGTSLAIVAGGGAALVAVFFVFVT